MKSGGATYTIMHDFQKTFLGGLSPYRPPSSSAQSGYSSLIVLAISPSSACMICPNGSRPPLLSTSQYNCSLIPGVNRTLIGTPGFAAISSPSFCPASSAISASLAMRSSNVIPLSTTCAMSHVVHHFSKSSKMHLSQSLMLRLPTPSSLLPGFRNVFSHCIPHVYLGMLLHYSCPIP